MFSKIQSNCRAEVGGAPFMHAIHLPEARTPFHMGRISSALRMLLFVNLAFCAATGHRARLNADDNRVIETFTIGGHGSAIFLPVQIGDGEYSFLLDTGSTTNVVDKSLRSALKATGRKETLNGKDSVATYRIADATVGHSRLPLEGLALCIDLTGFRSILGIELHGVIGMEFLREYVVQIDFDTRRASFLQNGDDSTGRRIPMPINSQGCPTVEVQLPGIGDVPFVIDSGLVGFRNGNLSTSLFDRLVDNNQLNVFEKGARTKTIHGIGKHRAGVLSSQVLAAFRHERQIFAEGDWNALSLSFLSRFTVTFDFPNQTLFLTKGNCFDEPFPPNPSGIQFDVVAGEYIVRGVDERGWAHKCGIRPGDRLLEIGGRETRRTTSYDVGSWLYSSSHELKLRVQSPSDSPRDVQLAQ